MKTYTVNEVFYSIQGEGVRAGTANVFVRFSGCNLTCRTDNEAGFDCDTEFVSGTKMNLDELVRACGEAVKDSPNFGRSAPPPIIFTGGEPGLQVDRELIDAFKALGVYLAIETNGTVTLPSGLDWICVSPKSAEHTIRQLYADEVKYVRNVGQGIPRPACEATHKLISPAFRTVEKFVPNDALGILGAPGTGITVPHHEPEPGALAWCIKLVKENPSWRLSVQQHKGWNVR